MGFFTKIAKFLGGSTQATTAESRQNNYPSTEYKGFTITPQPIADQGQFRVAALIEKASGEGQERRRHHFIRSDMVTNADQAAELAISKCKVFIDQLGEGIFN